MSAVATALNFALPAPTPGLIDAGTVSAAVLLVIVIVVSAAAAGWVNVTVQVAVSFGPRAGGLHAIPETVDGASRFIVAVWELSPSVAVTVAL
jgi:hypothetical protein